MAGSSPTRAFWRITLRMAFPALCALTLLIFVRAFESFEVPALLGLPVGIEVFTSSIYTAVHRYPSQVGLASAYSVALLVITSAGVFAVARLSGTGSKYATMTGKGFRPRQIDLGRWRWFTAGIFLVYFLLIVAFTFFYVYIAFDPHQQADKDERQQAHGRPAIQRRYGRHPEHQKDRTVGIAAPCVRAGQ